MARSLKELLRRFRVLKQLDCVRKGVERIASGNNAGAISHFDLMRMLDLMSDMRRAQLLAQPPYTDSKRLERYGYKVYSQNEEDGMIAEIFARIGTTNRFFVEFGVQNGLECNSHYLLFQGWEGVFIEGSAEYCEQIRKNFKQPIASGKLTLLNAFITAENINELIASTKAAKLVDIDLLSIDIDGNDYWVFKAISVIKPRVVVIEINAKFPPPVEYVKPYEASFVWDGSDVQGVSLESIAKLARTKGYTLVGTDLNGVNAFFVRDDLCGDKFAGNGSAKALYNPPCYDLCSRTGHHSKYFLPNGAE